ncbi:MAG: alpha-N-arabinofuranosidase [Calditrichaceae bacterium]|nr:alpha-N-arabinofuranosidase [Calditrichaceae bacterium]MBN2707598.1 alpha-N-arabinofuranosidase [Calditrichaceae bacterium]RQV93224.1 MAG: alpha-N-arabinofuranosidase [Calditrichota bacterium]
MKKQFITLLLIIWATTVVAQNKVIINADSAKTIISKHIYGHFAEHISRVIYDGIYIGENNPEIPNTNGVRNDVIEALKKLNIPNLRWPGGCFADTYHWKDAIGPKSERKAIENLSWGNYREDNSFGTHEFLNLCELLGAEPYLAVNMNSGSVQEAVEWVQYVNHPNGTSYLTDLREKYGRDKPWKVKYWGIGNESWDCGGHMNVEHYINLYKQFATAMTDYFNSKKLFRIAVGPGFPDYNWTEKIMKDIPARRFEGLSIHHYAVNWDHKSSSYEFNDDEYFMIMEKAWFMEEFIIKNSEVMDKYDPKKRVALIVDEWGGWYDPDPRGNGALYQQNTMRDAMIAGITLNIFNNHADRVRMANLAQTVNALQSVILTIDEKMILTPTYHVMEMYKVHQDALLAPVTVMSNDFVRGDKKLQAVSVSASKDQSGKMHISLTNIDNHNDQKVEIALKGFAAKKISGRILTSKNIQDHNNFDNPEKIAPKAFDDASLSGDKIHLTIPANSVVVLELEK